MMSLAGHTDRVLALGNLPGGLIASGGQDKNMGYSNATTC